MPIIKIILNGEEKILEKELSLTELIAQLQLDITKIAIEKDLEIVHPQDFSRIILNNGAKLEIVHFIGGG